MTAIAALVAEAIAKAEAETPAWTEDEMPRFGVTREEMILDVETDANEQKRLPKAERFPGTEVVRRDVFDAALAHLATRAVEAEGRAERAEARAFWQMVCIAKARECIWRKMNARDAEGRGALHDEHDRLLAFAGVERGDWCAP